MFEDFNKKSRGAIPLFIIFDLATLSDETGTIPVYGAKDLLRSLKRQGHTLAVTSQEPENRCIQALKESRFLDFFEERVYAPNPDFPQILSALKAAPGETVSVQLEPEGVEAAKEAGLLVFAYADPRFSARMDGRRRVLERAGADHVVETLIDIDTLLTARALRARAAKLPEGPGFTFN